MNNTEKFNKLRKLFKEYEALNADEAYTLIFVMPVKEFLEQAKKQLNHPPAPSYVTPGQVTITPLSNPDPNEPLKGIETT